MTDRALSPECTVFLSYSRSDIDQARELFALLRDSGCDPWMDTEGIVGGTDWEYEIRMRIRTADCFVTCLSGTSIAKEGVFFQELREALERQSRMPPQRVFIIPVLLDNATLPQLIAHLHAVDYRGPGGPDGVVRAVHRCLATARKAPEAKELEAQPAPNRLDFSILEKPIDDLSQGGLATEDSRAGDRPAAGLHVFGYRDNPIELLQEMLRQWLLFEPLSAIQLARWLEGYDLPPVGFDEEPFKWLSDAAKASRPMIGRVAEAVARLLDDAPDRVGMGREPSKLLYNLLSLAAELEHPAHLSAPLYRMLERRSLKGEWCGIDLRVRLMAALVMNQSDARLLGLWGALTRGEATFLPGTREQGFAALIETVARLGLDGADHALSDGLDSMISHYERTGHQRRLRQLGQRLTSLGAAASRSRIQEWNRKFHWPDWVVEELNGVHSQGRRG